MAIEIKDSQKVFDCIKQAWDHRSPERETYNTLLSYALGPWWKAGQASRSTNGTTPTNLLGRVLRSYGPAIAPENITARCVSELEALQQDVEWLEKRLDHYIGETNLPEAYWRATVDAMCGGMGILYTGCYDGDGFLHGNGFKCDPGKAFTRYIPFEHYASDPDARVPEEDAFRAVWYPVRVDWLKELGYDAENLEDGAYFSFPMRGKADQYMGAQGSKSADTMFDRVWLIEVYLYIGNVPHKGILLYEGNSARWLAATADPATPGAVPMEHTPKPHTGWREGPLDFVRLMPIQSSTIGLSPLIYLAELHTAMAINGAKMVRDAEESRRKVLVKQGMRKEALEIIESDQTVHEVPDLAGMTTVDFAGVSPQDQAAHTFLTNEANQEGMNLQLMSGADSQSRTLGQDQILFSQARGQLGSMQRQAEKALKSIMRHYVWIDMNYEQQKKTNLVMPTSDGGSVAIPYDPMLTEGDLLDMTVGVQPLASMSSDPVADVQRWTEAMTVAVPNIMQLAAIIPPNRTAGMWADKLREPLLRKLFNGIDPVAMDMMIGQQAQGMAERAAGGPGAQAGGMGARGQYGNTQPGARVNGRMGASVAANRQRPMPAPQGALV